MPACQIVSGGVRSFHWNVMLVSCFRTEKPDAIMSSGCDLLYEMLPRRGWRILRDVGLAWLACLHLGHPCSGIYQNGQLLRATAIDILIAQVERNESGPPAQGRTLMVEGSWNEGETLQPLLV